MSDYPEARTTEESTSAYLHDIDIPSNASTSGIVEATRVSVLNQITNGTRLQLVVKGQSYLEAGDKITFNLRNVAADNPDGEDDPQYSGDYIISKIRHRITPEDYKQVLECVKDSVKSRWPGEVSEFPSRASRGTGVTIDIYKEEN